MKKSAFNFIAFLILISTTLVFNSCLTETDFGSTFDTEITTDYLLQGDLDEYIQEEQVFREKGKPGVVTIPIGVDNLEDYENCFVLYISNGSDSVGTVSSAIITLDGSTLLNTSDFSGTGVLYDFEVCSLTCQSVLEVEVRGEPGTYIEIWMEGKLKKPLLVNSGTFIDERDGHEYKWVEIGNQIWMAENLAYLPSINPSTSVSLTTPYYYVYGYNGTNVSEAQQTENYALYGALYNWPAAMAEAPSSSTNPSGVQGICPSGWHLPSDAEWIELLNYIAEAGYINIGAKALKSISGWDNDGNGRDSYGFNGFPGGHHNNNGDFILKGVIGIWWSSTVYVDVPSRAWWIGLQNTRDEVLRNDAIMNIGLSVRCVKD